MFDFIKNLIGGQKEVKVWCDVCATDKGHFSPCSPKKNEVLVGKAKKYRIRCTQICGYIHYAVETHNGFDWHILSIDTTKELAISKLKNIKENEKIINTIVHEE